MSMPARRVLLDLSVLEERIGYTFKKRALLVRAVTHRSFGAEHNERLEFLGDSVLNCVVGHALFLRDKHYTEGVLSRTRANFVCEKTLDEIAAEIDIGSFIRLGEGELKTGGAKRPSILAAGNVTPERFAKDAKTQLQEFLQAAHMKLPEYRVITTTGAAHNQTFRCACVIENPAVTCEGEGKSRRAAEQMAAAAVLAKLQAIKS